MADLYDVVFLGVDVGDLDREASISGIAELLGMEREEIQYLVEHKLEATVREAVPMAEARKFQAAILRLGGICNYHPAQKSGLKLELAPIDDTPEESFFICPACDYRQRLESEAERPVQCPQCGVIPSKYDKVAALKEERERIKRRLLNMHKIREQQSQQIKDTEARQRELEEKIRKELGLPKAINSRSRIMGSAVALWLLGMGMGGGGMGFYYQGQQLTAAASTAVHNNPAADYFLRDNNNPNLSPQQDSLQHIISLSRTAYQHPTVVQGGPDSGEPVDGRPVVPAARGTGAAKTADGKPASARPAGTGAGTAAGSAKAATPGDAASQSKLARLDANLLWQAVTDDREWNQFLASQSRRQIEAGQSGKAYHLADAISSPALKMRIFGELLDHFRNENNVVEGENLTNLMVSYANGLPNIDDRIEAFGVLAVALSRGGDVEKTQQYLESAEKLALTLENPADNAQALARAATYQTLAGKQAQAEANFRRVNTLIHSLQDKQALLRVYVKLSTSYAESGNRVIAMAILAEVLGMANQVADTIERSRLLGEISDAFVKLGDADSALAIADKLDPAVRDKALYTVACELAYADRPYDAMKGLDKIEAPENKARAAILVSALQRSHSGMEALSASLQEKALAIQGQVLNPQDQTIVRGEAARYLAHAGQTQVAEEWAKKALASAMAVGVQERDAAAALLAVNLARANQPKLAGEAITLIVAPLLNQEAGRETAKAGKLFGEI